MHIASLTVGAIQTNCHIIGDQETQHAMIVDPGGDVDRIMAVVDEQKWDIAYVINTHAHFDHIMGNAKIMRTLRKRQKTPPQLIVHPRAVPLLEQNGGASLFGFYCTPSPPPDRLIDEGEELKLGTLVWRILHTPGHSPGSICLYCAAQDTLLSGDVLFKRGVGRTDLPGGDWNSLLDSIERKLFTLPDRTLVYAGHGPPTTIGEEKKLNPFVT